MQESDRHVAGPERPANGHAADLNEPRSAMAMATVNKARVARVRGRLAVGFTTAWRGMATHTVGGAARFGTPSGHVDCSLMQDFD